MISINLDNSKLIALGIFFKKYTLTIVILILSLISVAAFIYYLKNGLGLSYNDARSHLDIGRRVVEGLKPGLAQLGSVWLPLDHVLMIPLVWNDWAWHSGFAGAFWNMLSYVGIGVLIYKYLEKLKVGMVGRLFGVFIFASNLNVLYLQSTAMTEPLLLFTMLAGCYYLMLWMTEDKVIALIKSSFWIMLSTLVRYDGWFLLAIVTGIVALRTWYKKGYKTAEGTVILFCTLAAFGVVLWIGWNLLIFKDPLYFAFGPYSAHAQQEQMLAAGALPTKGNFPLSLQTYLYAMIYNSVATVAFMGIIATIVLWFDKKIDVSARLASTALWAPFLFNVVALVFGFSVIFIQGISGNTWFNVRYGVKIGRAHV